MTLRNVCVLIAMASSMLLGMADSTEELVTAPSAQEYLGQFTYFRTWKMKRRLLIVYTNDAKADDIRNDAVNNFRCQMAVRNMNLIVLGKSKGTETVFLHSEDNRRDFLQTRKLSPTLHKELNDHLRNMYRDLNQFGAWSLLIGYDGGRKRMYRKVNFDAVFDKIDRMPMRRREMEQQRLKKIECKNTPTKIMGV